MSPETYTCPPDHKHGQTTQCYCGHGCRCDTCRIAARDRQRALRKAHAYGVFQPPSVDSRGTVRRLEALLAIGWSGQQIAARLGRARANVLRILHLSTVTTRTRDDVARIYDDLWDKQPPRNTHAQRTVYTRTRNLARRHGWLPPLAWDDIDTDEAPPEIEPDPDYIDEVLIDHVIAGHHLPLTYNERREVIRRTHPLQMSDRELQERTGIPADTVMRIRNELGLPAHYDHAGRIAA